MAGRRTPPPYQLRKADAYSGGLARGLVLAYPMLEGAGSRVANYGSWGNAADLALANVTWANREGVQGLDFTAASSVAASAALSGRIIPNIWSYAFWVKLDSSPSGTVSMDAFSLQGSLQTNLRAWADTTGVWSWQKRVTADAYSVLPALDYPNTGARLVIATFSGIDTQPPVQLRTDANLQNLPQQPTSYQSFNLGAGAQANDLTKVLIGNGLAGTTGWDGVIGPVYFWNRVISDGEVWQLWQDPYAPLRRRGAQIHNPALMLSQADYTTEDKAVGKPSYLRQIFSGQTALFINVTDTYFYQNNPADSLTTSAKPVTLINIADTYAYQTVPVDSINNSAPGEGTQTPLIIAYTDTYTYLNTPVDTLSGGTTDTIAPTVITISDTYTYQTDPTDSTDTTPPGGLGTPLVITQADAYTYQADPADSVTGSTA
jgi:hypothetical protein